MKMYLLLAALMLSIATYAQQSQTCCVTKPSCKVEVCDSKASTSEISVKAETKSDLIQLKTIEAKSSSTFLLSTLIANAIALISNVNCDLTHCDPATCLPGGVPPNCDPSKCDIKCCRKK